MKQLIYSMALTIVLTCVVAIDFSPARAAITTTSFKLDGSLSFTYVHCRRVYHCRMTTRGETKVRRCHVCG